MVSPRRRTGNAVAQFNLGLIYHNGEGISQDQAEAVKWYRRAAEQGDAQAQCNLGLMYDNRRGRFARQGRGGRNGIAAPPNREMSRKAISA